MMKESRVRKEEEIHDSKRKLSELKGDCKKMTEDNNMFKENLYRMKADNEAIRKNVKKLRKNLDQLELDIIGIKENEVSQKEFDLENLKK